VGSNIPLPPHYNTTATTITRANNFVNPPPLHLEESDFTAKELHKLVQHVHALLRSSAYDETVLEQLIDGETRFMLSLAFLFVKSGQGAPHQQLDVKLGCGNLHRCLGRIISIGCGKSTSWGGTQKWLETDFDFNFT